MHEDAVCIGDVFRAGQAVVQVFLPRDPCRTLDRLTDILELWIRARDSGKLGFHMRTLEEGLVSTGDAFELVRGYPDHITVAEVLNLYHGRSQDRELARRRGADPFGFVCVVPKGSEAESKPPVEALRATAAAL